MVLCAIKRISITVVVSMQLLILSSSCEEGFHVAFEDEEISCKQCSPGTFSLGGGYRIGKNKKMVYYTDA